jgi:hypothetical protein
MAAPFPLGSSLSWFWQGAGTLVKIKAKERETDELLVIVAGSAVTAAPVYKARRANTL